MPPVTVPAKTAQGPDMAALGEVFIPFAPLMDIRLPELEEAVLTHSQLRRRVGIGRSSPHPHEGDVADQLVWVTAQSGDLVTTLQLTSVDANALRVGLRAVLPRAATLRFLEPKGGAEALVASRWYTRVDFGDGPSVGSYYRGKPDADMAAHATVWSPILNGEVAGIEIVLPGTATVADVSLEVVGVSHFAAPLWSGRPVADGHVACPSVDVLCSRAPQCELDAALRLTFTDATGNSYSCSATAVNDSRSMAAKLAGPSVLTSRLCLSDAYDAESVVANWHQRSTGCGSGTLTNRYRELNGGADLLVSHPESNHTLLRLRDPVPTDGDRCLAGWTTVEDVLGATTFAVHHGASGLKEWAEGDFTERTDFTLSDGQVVSGYQVDVEEGALWDGSAGAGWFIQRDGETSYVGVQSRVQGEDCGVASAGSFAAFFDAVGSPHLGEAVDLDDHGDSAVDATVVDIGASGTAASDGTIAPGGDVDVFRVHVANPGILTAYTRGDMDTVGHLTTDTGDEIAHDDDGGAGGNFRLVADVDAGTYLVRVRAFEETTGDYTLVIAFAAHSVPRALTYSVPLFLAADDTSREGFLRVINRSDTAGTVDITAIDDSGRARGPVPLALGERETVHINSADLEGGNAAEGLPAGVGDGDGNWRLMLESSLHLTPQAFVRTSDGFVTSMHDVIGPAARSHRVAFFNPPSNNNQRSVLRLINPTPDRVVVTIMGRDDDGRSAPRGTIRVSLAPSSSVWLTSQQLENGTAGATGRLGDGAGKWELAVEADGEILAMSLLETPTGHLTNLSTINQSNQIPLFLGAGGEREGFLRIINNAAHAAAVSISATDAAGVGRGPVTFVLEPRAATHFNSGDLEDGNAAKGLTGDLGDGTGPWHLVFSSDQDITTQAYVRTADGFVTSMHELVPLTGLSHDVAFFNPASNPDQRSWLQLTNLEDRPVGVAIEGRDDAGDAGLAAVTFDIAANAVRTVSSAMLEAGDQSLRGRLGDGTGKWQLAISASGAIEVLNLLETPTGHLANLSTTAARPFGRAFNDVFIEPETTEMVSVDGVALEAARNQVLVFLDADITSAELRAVEAMIAAQGGERLALSTRLRTIQVGIDDGVDESAFIEAVSAAAGVHAVGVNAVLAADNAAGFDRSVAQTQAAVDFPGDYWIDHIHAESAWQALAGVTLQRSPIGVVDTGLPSSQTVIERARLRRFSSTGLPAGGYFGTSSHGLWVTGLASGEHAGDQRGVNPYSEVVLVDVERRGVVYESAVLQGIQTAIDNGAKVVNVSFGDGAACTDARAARLASRERLRRIATNALDYARRRDALVVWSAGSDCEKNDDRYLPVAATDTEVHAWDSHAVVVGASTALRVDACFSRMGHVVDLVAPGHGIAFGPGRPLLYGTSYAAPLVAGTAALVRAIGPTLSAPETKALVLASASGAIGLQTAAMNDTQCASRYAGGAMTVNRPGQATTPEELLNLGSAVQSARVAAAVPRQNARTTMLKRGARAQVPVEVHVPSTGVSSADVVFLVDQTESFEDDIATLHSAADTILEGIRERGIDVHFGVAGFGDFSVVAAPETVFDVHQNITDSIASAKMGIDALDTTSLPGGDAPEAQYEALYRATNQFWWRVGALRVILLATDAPFHDSDTRADYPGIGREAALALLQREDVVVIGLQSGDDAMAREQLRELALATGGNVQELDTASSEIDAAIEEGLDDALGSVDVQLDIVSGDPWVLGVTPFAHRGVAGGATVTFTVHLEGKLDSSIDPITQDIRAWAWGDGSGLVGRARIPVVVPSEPTWRLSAAGKPAATAITSTPER